MVQTAVCRIAQFFTRAASALLPWREPRVIEGEGSALRLPELLKADGVKHPLLVTGPTLRRLGVSNGLTAALAEIGRAHV